MLETITPILDAKNRSVKIDCVLIQTFGISTSVAAIPIISHVTPESRVDSWLPCSTTA